MKSHTSVAEMNKGQFWAHFVKLVNAQKILTKKVRFQILEDDLKTVSVVSGLRFGRFVSLTDEAVKINGQKAWVVIHLPTRLRIAGPYDSIESATLFANTVACFDGWESESEDDLKKRFKPIIHNLKRFWQGTELSPPMRESLCKFITKKL